MTESTYTLSMLKNSEFKTIQNITQSDFLKYSEYILRLMHLKNDENLFKIVELNHKDLVTKIGLVTKKLDDDILHTLEQEHLHLEINRLILNLLSSIRTYLDHTETRLKRQYGAESAEYKLFKFETSNAYDNSFAYRFLYKLRNYSQHCGLPAGSLTTHSFKENGVINHLVRLSLLRDNLLQEFDWGNPVTEELKKQEEQFEILVLINLKYELLRAISEKIKLLAYANHKEAGFALLNLLLEIKDKDGSPCILQQTPDGKKTHLNIRWFPFDSITNITGVRLVD